MSCSPCLVMWLRANLSEHKDPGRLMNPCNLISESAPGAWVSQRNTFSGMPCKPEGYCLKGVRTYYEIQRQKEYGDCLKVITGVFKETGGMVKTADVIFSRTTKERARERRVLDESGREKEWENRGEGKGLGVERLMDSTVNSLFWTSVWTCWAASQAGCEQGKRSGASFYTADTSLRGLRVLVQTSREDSNLGGNCWTN